MGHCFGSSINQDRLGSDVVTNSRSLLFAHIKFGAGWLALFYLVAMPSGTHDLHGRQNDLWKPTCLHCLILEVIHITSACISVAGTNQFAPRETGICKGIPGVFGIY